MVGEMWNVLENVMVGEKVFYDGYVVVVVVVIFVLIVKDVLKLIEVDYEVLFYVIDVDKVMVVDVLVICEGLVDRFVFEGLYLNVVCYYEFGYGDVDVGFVQVDLIMEDIYKIEVIYQGYIEFYVCFGMFGVDGKGEFWCIM